MKKLLVIGLLTVSMLAVTACGNQTSNASSSSSSAVASGAGNTSSGSAGNTASTTATATPNADATAAPTAEPTATPAPTVLTRVKQKTSYKADGTVSYQQVFEYDAAGHNIKKTSLDADGNVRNWYTYEFDAAGNLTGESYYLSDGSLSTRKENVYNANGVKIQYTVYKGDGSVSSKQTFNDDGVLLEYIGGVQAPKVTYTLDADNRVVGVQYYDDDLGGLYSWEEHTYDASGNETITIYSVDGLSHTTLQEYDAAGNLLAESSLSSGTAVLLDSYTYDDAGNMLTHTTYGSDGQPNGYTIYTYDENGKKTFMGEYLVDRTLAVWENYEYDEKGALVKYVQEDMTGMKFVHVNRSFVYDENGRPLEEITYNSSDEIYSRLVYEYMEIVVEQ